MSVSRTRLRGFSALLVITGMAGALFATAAHSGGIGFVAVRIADAQGLRVGLSNLLETDDPRLPPDPCRGSVTFYDAAGTPVSAALRFTLAPGASTHLSIVPSSGGLLPGTASASRRAVVRFARPGASSADGVPPPEPCRGVFAGAEIFNAQTGQTLFVNPAVIRGFDPQPEPPTFGYAE